MNPDQAIVEFLARPENFPAALEIAQHMERVKDHVVLQFWHGYRDEMTRRLIESNLTGHWHMRLKDDQLLRQPYAECRIAYRPDCAHALHLDVPLWVGPPTERLPLHYGLCWSREVPETPAIPEIAELAQVLETMWLKPDGQSWWFKLIRLQDGLRENEFLLRTIHTPDAVTEEYADLVWMFFEQIRGPLEKVNDALSDHAP